MTIPTNQYEADEKFDVEQDKLEERIQKRIKIIYDSEKLTIDALNNYLSNYDAIDSIEEAIYWQAERDIKNDED